MDGGAEVEVGEAVARAGGVGQCGAIEARPGVAHEDADAIRLEPGADLDPALALVAVAPLDGVGGQLAEGEGRLVVLERLQTAQREPVGHQRTESAQLVEVAGEAQSHFGDHALLESAIAGGDDSPDRFDEVVLARMIEADIGLDAESRRMVDRLDEVDEGDVPGLGVQAEAERQVPFGAAPDDQVRQVLPRPIDRVGRFLAVYSAP